MVGPAEADKALPEMWDWEIVQDDWWKTSFSAISWTYKTKPDHPRPPHYHDLLARGRRRRIEGDAQKVAEGAPGDVSLNTGLCGVRAAEEAIRRYELEAAILSAPSASTSASETALSLEGERSSRSELLYAQDTWDEKVRELLGGILEQGVLPEVNSLSSDVPLWDLNHLESPTLAPSSLGMADLTDSEMSVESDRPPSTPKPTKASYARIVSSDFNGSPTVLSPLPSKILSAAALTFIPSTPNRASSREPTTPPLTSSSNSSDSPFSSPTYNFHFPSLKSESPTDRRESRSLPPSLQKDESGFYIEVTGAEVDLSEDIAVPGVTQSLNGTRSTTPRRPSAAFLPAFLTDGSPSARSRVSKTREIVDRLRSSGSAGSGRKTKKSSRRQGSSKDPAPAPADAHTTTTSAQAANGEDSVRSDGWIPAAVSEDPSSSTIVIDDGWITQGTTQTQQQQPVRANSSLGSASGSSSNTHSNSHQSKSHKHGHGHKRSSASSNASHPTSTAAAFSPTSSTMSLNVPHTPATVTTQLPHSHAHTLPHAHTHMPHMYTAAATAVPYPYAAVPYAPNAAAFMQMQYQSATRGPWQMGYQPGLYPMYQPFGVGAAVPYGMVVPVAPMQAGVVQGVFYDGKSKSAGAMV